MADFNEHETNLTSFTAEPANVVADLLWIRDQCDLRCLFECSKWANEQLFNISEDHLVSYLNSLGKEEVDKDNRNCDPNALRQNLSIEFIRSLINNKEFRRAKFLLSKCKRSTAIHHFLYYYSWYLGCLRNKFENDADDLERKREFYDYTLVELKREMEAQKANAPEQFDCFMNYLLGLIRKETNTLDMAIGAFREAIDQDNRCWPAWDSLSALVDAFYSVNLEKEECGKTWICSLFIAETMFRLQLFVCAINAYTAVSKHALGSTPYIICQIAAAQSEMQEHDSAISSFQMVRRMDPYRIDQMHLFSDSLYIRNTGAPEKLADLAKWFYQSHKFHWETCCIVANYYSARKGHDMAQDFLKRAIKLYPTNASIWVLLGHEYMETKNHQFAIASYRKAIVIDPVCYRGWYGLGQLYEILKQPTNALYHYQQAHKCRPADSRMLIALGVISLKLGRKSDSEKCFKKAFQIGDVEGNALTHLAKLYEEQNDTSNAAKAYEAYLKMYTEELVGDLNLIATASRYLASYYMEVGDLDQAYNYAQRCLNFDSSKEEGMRVLRQITNARNKELTVSQKLLGTPLRLTTPDAGQRNYISDDDLRTPTVTAEQKQVDLCVQTDDDMNMSEDDDVDIF